jgi:hypothetical protein
MTDTVERLRRWGGPTRPYGSISDTCDEAAARIERLRAALSPFASTKTDDGYDYISGLPDMVIIRIEASVREIKAARAALEETSNDQA